VTSERIDSHEKRKKTRKGQPTQTTAFSFCGFLCFLWQFIPNYRNRLLADATWIIPAGIKLGDDQHTK
jgi:hypothetical protein